MNLKLLLPHSVLLDKEVSKVVAEAANGQFCLLARHVDFVAALVPGLLSYVDAEQREQFVAVDEGILVKCGSEVLVSTRKAIAGPDLDQLQKVVDEQFYALDERERMTRAASAKLEAGLVRRFLELEKHGP